MYSGCTPIPKSALDGWRWHGMPERMLMYSATVFMRPAFWKYAEHTCRAQLEAAR
jgi:hypothetical protein